VQTTKGGYPKEMAMKRVAVIVAVLILILSVSAAELTDYSYKKVAPTDETIKVIEKIIGIEPAWEIPAEGYIEVTINGGVVAQIPEDSKFADIVIHDQCLPNQYGTTAWYDCEVPLQ
jgi:hypothetical protein